MARKRFTLRKGILLKNTVFVLGVNVLVLFCLARIVHQAPTADVDLSIGTIIRGNEWEGEFTPQKKIVLSALKSIVYEVGAHRTVVLVDKLSYCRSRPHFLRAATCRDLVKCRNPTLDVPTLPCVFKMMLELSKTEHLAFINGDILILEGFAESVAFVSTYEKYVMVGRRHHLEATSVPMVTKHDLHALRTAIQEIPFAHGYALDYFVLRRQDWIEILEDLPAFVVGAWRWDNFLLAKAYKQGFLVIDASYTATILHQRGEPQHEHSDRRGADLNNRLATSKSGADFWFGSVAFADIVLEKNGSNIICRPKTEIQSVVRKAFNAGIFHGFDEVKGVRNVFDDFNMELGSERTAKSSDHALLRIQNKAVSTINE